jgi:hypothetical protein
VTPSEIEAIDAQATVLMKRGLGLIEDARPDGNADALICFERALVLRRRLPFETQPRLAYGLAACWLNRADVLMRVGDDRSVTDAISSYDEALRLLRRLPLHEDERFCRRLAIALQNRGLALRRQPTPAAAAESVAAFTEAIDLLGSEAAAGVADRRSMLATIWLNLASVLVSANQEAEPSAPDAARQALALVADLEREDAAAAEVGILARHVLCRALAAHVSSTTTAGAVPHDQVHEATDAVEEGLDLVRVWERNGVNRFRALAHDLFRFGAQVYALHQPQFLNEFVGDIFDPARSTPAFVTSVEMRTAYFQSPWSTNPAQ